MMRSGQISIWGSIIGAASLLFSVGGYLITSVSGRVSSLEDKSYDFVADISGLKGDMENLNFKMDLLLEKNGIIVLPQKKATTTVK